MIGKMFSLLIDKHFGLGFYSAFMVADEVHIDTLSYKTDAKPVHRHKGTILFNDFSRLILVAEFQTIFVQKQGDRRTDLCSVPLIHRKFRAAVALRYKARIDVVVNPEKKTLAFIDNGLGMTAEEVEEYINQISLPFRNIPFCLF